MESFRSNVVSLIKPPSKNCHIKFINSISNPYKNKTVCMATNLGFSIYQWSLDNELDLKDEYVGTF